jgi:hypothetical protein
MRSKNTWLLALETLMFMVLPDEGEEGDEVFYWWII